MNGIERTDIGPTEKLSLRVSVATLVRVLFENPRDRELMLALERKATLHETKNGRDVEVKAQPFGGAIRIRNLSMLQDRIGDFHFDGEQSRAEQDFRIFIQPSNWEVVREVCIQHLSFVDDPILETDPERELTEEFADALKVKLTPDQYSHQPIATIIEDDPAPAKNIHARDTLTARVYRIFEARIVDSSLTHILMTNSESLSHQDLCELASEDAQSGGKGRANAILALPLKRITNHYLGLAPEECNTSILFEDNRLEETVTAILEGVTIPKYQRL